VTSPTYQLARGYRGTVGGGKVAINHLDLYRLEGLQDRDVLELEDYLEPEAITFVEWAPNDALGAIEDPTLVLISHRTPTTRQVSLTGPAVRRMPRC
jgi:tRNA threonylcarbamoyladenosine biosynthesis protein TsaE